MMKALCLSSKARRIVIECYRCLAQVKKLHRLTFVSFKFLPLFVQNLEKVVKLLVKL